MTKTKQQTVFPEFKTWDQYFEDCKNQKIPFDLAVTNLYDTQGVEEYHSYNKQSWWDDCNLNFYTL